MKKPKCPCPIYCKYCGAKRRKDSVGHYCPTKNCQWNFGYKCCTLSDETSEIPEVQPKKDHK